ncbi:MAG: T9SS type A sorting domain-containing protein [Spirochaetes bacterium]|nr:T9SS type A sorting domain-containing protein [Spirochaetota bacterium]
MLRKLAIILVAAIALLSTLFSAEKYAVLITGDYAADGIPESMKWQTYQSAESDKPGAMECFWNDTFLMWKMLIEMGYEDDNIFVLFANGQDYSITNPEIADEYDPVFVTGDEEYKMTDYPATKNNINLVASELSGKLTKDDFLFVWTFDHGGFEGIENIPVGEPIEPENEEVPSFLVLLNETGDDYDKIWDYDLGNLFNPLPANKKVYWMQQCFSGGFMYEMTHDVSDTSIPYGEHPVLENVFFNSASSWQKSAMTADNNIPIYTTSGDSLFYSINEVENEYIDGKPYEHGEFNFHMISATKQLKQNGDEYYHEGIYGYPAVHYDEVDGFLMEENRVYRDNIITVKETQLWDSVYQTAFDMDSYKNYYISPVYSDKSEIGYHTAIQYPTVIHDEFDDPSSYVFQPLTGEIYVIKDINVRNGGMILAENSETTMLENTSVAVSSKMTLSSSSVLKGLNNNKIISRPRSLLQLDNCRIENVDLVTDTGIYEITVNKNVNIINSDITVTSERLNSLSSLNINENSLLSIEAGSILTLDVNSALNIGKNSSLVIKSGSEFNMKNGSVLSLGQDSKLIIEEGAIVIIENGAKINAKMNSMIYGDLTLSAGSEINISSLAELHLSFSKLMFANEALLTMSDKSKMIVENGSGVTFESGALTNLAFESEIVVMNKGYMRASGTLFTNNGAIDKWLGINCLGGSTVQLNNVSVINAMTGIKGEGTYKFEVTNSVFEGCTNGIGLIGMQPGYDYMITDNILTGIDEGRGISITSSDGVFSRNKISHFAIGASFIMSSPAVSKCEFSYNKYYGILISGHDALPQLINTEQMQAYGELNCLVEKNAYGSGTSLFPSSQIGIIPVGNIYMRNNDIVSSPNFLGISIAHAAFINPQHILVDAQYNYWGAAEITDDYFFGHSDYTIDYEPYYSNPCGSGVDPSLMQSVSTESKILTNALNLEAKDNVTPAIKLYEHIIKKYVDTPEYYVAMARLPYLYEKAELDNSELIATYDEAIESDKVSHKEFFKGKKVATHIKGKRFDEAISLAEEMKTEADFEEEIILADINIAIANMLKNTEGKGRNETVTDELRKLIAKLNGSIDKTNPADISESTMPTQHQLFQNYPNPFNPVTQIKFALTKSTDVKLSVYNINGQLISQLASGVRQAGIHTVDFDGARFNSGVYYYTLEVEGKSLTQKMILMK